MRSSKLFVSVSAILFLLTTSLFAQSDSVSYKSQIQFNLVNGYSLSYLNSLTNTSAIRYRINLNLSVGHSNGDGSRSDFSNYDSDTYSNHNSYTYSNSREQDNNSQSLSFSVGYITYPVEESIFRMFLGAGPYCVLERNYQKVSFFEKQSTGYNNTNSNETLTYSLGLGVNGVMGFECFIAKQISLIGEYGVYAKYYWGRDKSASSSNSQNNSSTSDNGNSSENNSHGWNAGFSSLMLGVAFRF
ncbi:MAG: hypothetical protein M1495_12225 [Bacteroidetes bacterium]|nr:hypothetical protein [Bacteroidota bacterium]